MVEERIKLIIAKQLGVNLSEVTPEALFLYDLDANSLDMVELFMMIEEEFNIEIPDEDTQKMQKVEDVLDDEVIKQVRITIPPATPRN